MGAAKTQLSAISRMFSAGVLQELAKKGRSPLFARLYHEAGLLELQKNAAETVGSAYESAFSVLRKSGLRDEYVYRAALTHNILLGRHSLNSASMLTEFRAGNCKADLVILNGTGTAYEIKSERDSLTRLGNQIENYRKVFAKVYVIAGKSHVQEILESTPEQVGVLSLLRWNRIHTVREAAECFDTVCPVTIFESLRVEEAWLVLGNLNISVPDVPNMLLRSAMRELFEDLAPCQVHAEMVSVLKQKRNLASLSSLVDKLPASLKPAALSLKLRPVNRERLVAAIDTPLNEALTWA
jgi:hypothetical protein